MLHALFAFLGAFLLFFVQPFLGKLLTPGLGGGAQVWITCMLFFQACLLAGYGYAHLLVTRAGPRLQRAIHLGLLGLAAALLVAQGLRQGAPLDPGLPALDPQGSVTLPLLGHLALHSGLPFLALSATSPLLQAWFALDRPGADPYRLYAASNLGSLLGLLAYPFAAERFLSLPAQGWGFLALFLGLLAFPLLCGPRATAAAGRAGEGSSGRELALWLLASAGGSAVLMAGSSYLATEVAAVPLLWVLPLGLYLLTFILVFETPLVRFEGALRLGAGLLLLLSYLALLWPQKYPSPRLVVAGSLGLVFAGALLCHGCLYALRPPPARLTAFYLAMAGGGVVGGLFVAVLAPLVYDRLYELPIAVALAGGIGLLWAVRSRLRWGRLSGALPLAAAVVGLAGTGLLAFRPGVWVRDFYGSVQVLERGPVRAMLHGRIIHGAVRVDRPQAALTYYHPDSGVAQALALLRERKPRLRIGVVGLGVGALAAYGRPGDEIVFYEISPAVIEVAGLRGRAFNVLRDCPARVEVVPGDARRTLEQELRSRGGRAFDLLVVDAFNSDAVPWHLLTLEALQLDLDHLAPDGILALHISTPLPLARVVCTAARALDLYGALLLLPPPAQADPVERPFLLTSHYALLARRRETLDDPRIRAKASLGFGPRTFRGLTEASAQVPYLSHGRPWTDRRSSLSDLLFEKGVFPPR